MRELSGCRNHALRPKQPKKNSENDGRQEGPHGKRMKRPRAEGELANDLKGGGRV
jgi:hypothetical protein